MKITFCTSIYNNGKYIDDIFFEIYDTDGIKSFEDIKSIIAEKANEKLGTNLPYDELELSSNLTVGTSDILLDEVDFNDALKLINQTVLTEKDFEIIFEKTSYSLNKILYFIETKTILNKKVIIDKFLEDMKCPNNIYEYLDINKIIKKEIEQRGYYRFIIMDSCVMILF